MNKSILAVPFLALIFLSSCTVAVPLGVALQKNKLKSHTYAGLTPDRLKTRDDVSFTFTNDTTVSFIEKNDGATWVFQWESEEGNARMNEPGVYTIESPLPLPKTLSFQFEGDSIVAWESQGIQFDAMTRKNKIIIGCIVGLGLDVFFVVYGLQNLTLFPDGINLNGI